MQAEEYLSTMNLIKKILYMKIREDEFQKSTKRRKGEGVKKIAGSRSEA